MVIIKRTHNKRELYNKKQSILEEWQKYWKLGNSTEAAYDVFYNLFIVNYKDVSYKQKWNKNKNSFWKGIFIFVLIFLLLLYMVIGLKILFSSNDTEKLLILEGIAFLSLIFFGSIISKWIDIKKYQETWIRHSWHLYMLNREMLSFIYELEPYDSIDKRQIFLKRIIAIWDKNENKFVNNMEQKEKGLMDIFTNLKRLK